VSLQSYRTYATLKQIRSSSSSSSLIVHTIYDTTELWQQLITGNTCWLLQVWATWHLCVIRWSGAERQSSLYEYCQLIWIQWINHWWSSKHSHDYSQCVMIYWRGAATGAVNTDTKCRRIRHKRACIRSSLTCTRICTDRNKSEYSQVIRMITMEASYWVAREQSKCIDRCSEA